MLLQSSLLMLAIASLPSGGTPKTTSVNGPYVLRGEVLDVFQDSRYLLFIGTEDGARNGLKGILWRTGSNPAQCAVEFVEVGAKHSVVRAGYLLGDGGYVDPLSLLMKIEPLVEKDSVVWYSSQPRPQPAFPITQAYMQRGGAIIDLTTPEGAKMLPRRK